MKKHLLSMALGLMMSAGAFAQVEFVDAQGNVIPSGSTIVRNHIETALELPIPNGKKQLIDAGLGLKNTSANSVSVKTKIDVTDLPFGAFSLCYPNGCWITVGNYVGTYPTHKPDGNGLSEDGPWTSPQSVSLSAGQIVDKIQTEWYLSNIGQTSYNGELGEFTATYTILENGKEGSTIKVRFTTDQKATGISGIKSDVVNKTVVGTYNAAGQQVASGTKGLNIVKYSDGSCKKIVVK